MVALLYSLLELPNLISVLVFICVFATVLTFLFSIGQRDQIKSRMNTITKERDRLKSEHIAALNTKTSDLRLRGKNKTLSAQLVEILNLRAFFRAEKAQQRLRQAGYHSEKYLYIYLAALFVLPILFGIVAFIYTSTVYAERIESFYRPFVALLFGLFGYAMPSIILTNSVHKRQASISRAWSDALDLLLICVDSGIALEPAIQKVAKEISSQSLPLAEELSLTHAELSFLGDRRKAFYNLGARTGLASVRSTVTSFIQSERYGTPIGTALRVLAQENRDARMSEVERKAAALPPKLTVPMIVFFLPVIFVVLMGPALIKVFATFK